MFSPTEADPSSASSFSSLTSGICTATASSFRRCSWITRSRAERSVLADSGRTTDTATAALDLQALPASSVVLWRFQVVGQSSTFDSDSPFCLFRPSLCLWLVSSFHCVRGKATSPMPSERAPLPDDIRRSLACSLALAASPAADVCLPVFLRWTEERTDVGGTGARLPFRPAPELMSPRNISGEVFA